jgi:ribonuclease HI
MQIVDVYTDGSWSGRRNQIGGWAAVFYFRDPPCDFQIFGAIHCVEAVRAELVAVIRALDWLSQPSTVALYTDCPLVHFGMSGWLREWKSRGWRTSSWRRLSHRDLWKQIDAAAARHTITSVQVRAHAGVRGNLRADHLARKARVEAGQGGKPCLADERSNGS